MRKRRVYALVAGLTAVVAVVLMLTFVVAPGTARAQPASAAFWIADTNPKFADFDPAAVDIIIPLGSSRDTNADLCTGSGSCPSACPKPVQNLLFLYNGGGATVIRDIVMSVEVRPGSKGRQITASGSCAVADPNNPGALITWHKYVVTAFD